MLTNKLKPQTLKGFRDFLPADANKRLWLKNKLIDICESWGFDPIETPTLEYLDLFKGQIGDDEKLFFKFKDQGNREVALRYDQTVPSVRVLTQYQNQIIKPFKRFQIQTVFRSEKPQKGRYREFIQCDADIFGDPSPYADAETIALSLDIYRKLGFKNVKVLINDRTLLKNIPYEALVSVDKIKKIGDDGVISEMMKKGINKNLAVDYLKIIKSLKPNETIKIILDYLTKSGFDESWFEFDSTIARSFTYSEGPIWEIFVAEYTSGSVLGGERYNGLFESLFGNEMYGTGFGLGFDRTLEAAEQLGLISAKILATQILVTVFSPDLFKKSIEAANSLREQGIKTEIFSNPNIKLEKQLKYADRKGVPLILIIGPEEVKKNTVKLKIMKTGEQKEISQGEISKFLSKNF